MSDTRALLDKISAFRQRLDSMPRLTAAPAKVENTPPEPGLPGRVAVGSRTQAILEQSIRVLSEEPPAPEPVPTVLTAKAKRVLGEAKELTNCLKQLADDPLLAGPPVGHGVEADPLAIYYRETAAMMMPAVRLAGGMPDTPSVQSRLADGLEGILATVRQRLAALGRAMELRRRDAEQVNRLAHLLVLLNGEDEVDAAPFKQLAAEVLAEGPAVPLRFLYAPPSWNQEFLGGPEFPAPARFVAAHSLTTARVVSRMLRLAPEWRDMPQDAILAALIHDVGMLRVPVETLSATEPLNDEQRRQIEAHCRSSAEMVSFRLPALSHLVDAVTSHHERLDGTGYPSGRKADQVPPLARFLAVADVYAAMACPRPHRAAHDPRTALTDTLLYAEQNLLDRFSAEKLLALCFYPVGSVVEMSDGAIGVVAANRPGRQELHFASRPVLNLLIDAQGRLLPVPLPVDLAECEGGTIIRTLPQEERARLLGRHYPEWAL